MHPLRRLRQLLSPPPPPATGRVVATDAAGLTVATTRGTRRLQRLPGDATGYQAGDTVRVNGDAVTGRVAARARKTFVV